jgi:hypothetical protein
MADTAPRPLLGATRSTSSFAPCVLWPAKSRSNRLPEAPVQRVKITVTRVFQERQKELQDRLQLERAGETQKGAKRSTIGAVSPRRPTPSGPPWPTLPSPIFEPPRSSQGRPHSPSQHIRRLG